MSHKRKEKQPRIVVFEIFPLLDFNLTIMRCTVHCTGTSFLPPNFHLHYMDPTVFVLRSELNGYVASYHILWSSTVGTYSYLYDFDFESSSSSSKAQGNA